MEKKKRKHTRHKRKGVKKEQELDPEQESARALLQMRGAEVVDDGAPYHGGDSAASPQPIAKSSPSQFPDNSTVKKATKGSSTTSTARRKDKNNNSRAKTRVADFDVDQFNPSSNFERDEESRLLQLPSTPPNQTDRSSPSPYHQSIPQSQHALDDLPTDDECAMFDQEFRHGKPDTEPSSIDHDLFSFSQQPADAVTEIDTVESAYRLPVHARALPKAPGKNKKRKRREPSNTYAEIQNQTPSDNEAGQLFLSSDIDDARLEASPRHNRNSTKSFGNAEGDEMPIDPELHSMSALPPAVDLSTLDDGDANSRQTQIKGQDLSGPSKPRKRRRMDHQPTSDGQSFSYAPHAVQKDEKDIQDRVHSGSENIQRQTSPELGTPFIEGVAREGLEYLKSASKSANGSRKTKRKGGPTSSSPIHPESGQRDDQSKRSLKDVSGKGGQYTHAETAKLDNFRDKYCAANNMSAQHFNDLIQSSMRGNPQATALFNELHEVLPYRPRLSVQKCARRRFHNFSARGSWTAEEDEMLRHAVAEKGKSWKAVGEMIERMPGDCRDRWRNYLLNSEHRNREQWTKDEMRNLCVAILDCIQLMKDERRQALEEKYGFGAAEADEDLGQEAEDLKVINWQAVSDRMGEHGGARSQLQCRFKWTQIKRKDQENLLQAAREEGDIETAKSKPSKNPWRHSRASRKVANMKKGDQYILLRAVLDSNAPTEGNIPWKSLGDDDFRATWNSTDKKIAWMKMKANLDGFEAVNYQEVANNLLSQMQEEEPEELNERWDPEVDGDVSGPRRRQSKQRRSKERAKRNGERRKSDEFIVKSDDEDEDETTYESSNYNLSNTLAWSEEVNRYANINDQPSPGSAKGAQVNGDEDAQDSDQGSLFNEPTERSHIQPSEDRDISPNMASKVRMLQYE